jgi:hypothetical protein
MDFKQLKKQSSLGSLTEKLLKEAEKMGATSSVKDERIFQVERDKSGLGLAVVRFLPPPPGEEDAFVRLYNHGFKYNNKWLIENCPTSIGEQCPICASNSVLWDSGLDSNKKVASQRKRKLSFYSNVYIIKNPANPELEGTVMLFRYGQKIFDKIKSAMKPEFEGDDPIDPFDLWGGASLRIKVKTVKEAGGNVYPNYDESVFESPSALSDDDEELERIWKQCHSLKDLISPDKFKSQAELETRLNFVLGAPNPSQKQEEEELEKQFSQPEEDITEELEKSYRKSKSVIQEDDDEDEDEDLMRFRELAGE